VFELHPHLAKFILHRLLTGDQRRGSWLIEKLANSLDNSALGITGLGQVRHLDLGIRSDHSDARSTAPQMTRDSRCFGFSKRPSSENGSNHTSESREHVVMTTGPAWIGAITIDCDDAAAMRSIYK